MLWNYYILQWIRRKGIKFCKRLQKGLDCHSPHRFSASAFSGLCAGRFRRYLLDYSFQGVQKLQNLLIISHFWRQGAQKYRVLRWFRVELVKNAAIWYFGAAKTNFDWEVQSFLKKGPETQKPVFTPLLCTFCRYLRRGQNGGRVWLHMYLIIIEVMQFHSIFLWL